MPSVSLFGEYRKNCLTIERSSYESYDLSQQLYILAVQGEFRGAVNIWCEQFTIQRFIEQLRECEKLRRGEARLEVMSDESFSMRLFNTHPKGDFALAYEMNFSDCFLRGQFQLDPSLLLQILHSFEGFIITDPFDFQANA